MEKKYKNVCKSVNLQNFGHVENVCNLHACVTVGVSLQKIANICIETCVKVQICEISQIRVQNLCNVRASVAFGV